MELETESEMLVNSSLREASNDLKNHTACIFKCSLRNGSLNNLEYQSKDAPSDNYLACATGPLRSRSSVQNGASEVFDEPELGVILGDALELAELSSACSTFGNSLACSCKHDEEVHSKNTSGGVVLNAEIDVFIDTKAETSFTY